MQGALFAFSVNTGKLFFHSRKIMVIKPKSKAVSNSFKHPLICHWGNPHQSCLRASHEPWQCLLSCSVCSLWHSPVVSVNTDTWRPPTSNIVYWANNHPTAQKAKGGERKRWGSVPVNVTQEGHEPAKDIEEYSKYSIAKSICLKKQTKDKTPKPRNTCGLGCLD